MSERATIQQVAEHAGVSIGTVSRVLNSRAGVSQATRERVRASIRALAFRPDHVARALSKAPLRVGLSLASGTRRLTPFFMLFLEHLIARLQQDGYRFEEVPAGRDGLPEWLPNGVILHGAHEDDPRLAYLRDQGVPFVLVGRAPGVRWVAPDDHDGGLQATRHLLALGHREILHLGGLMGHQAFQDRYGGYLQALDEAGIGPRRDWLLDGGFTTLGGYRAVRRAFESGCACTAVFAASDEMALGAIAALEDLGLTVPLDVSVVGFDDLPEVADALRIPEGLTSVRQDIAHITATAVTLLQEGLNGAPIRSETVPVQLMARGTTARRRR
ncbi:MAG TPA: LacI family DNA-binding transcriptional regulator [Trueperaceae bacterium]|nr:LacI family DNA-binding transcriptional regulator [Trueperaceae bacterium]